jgi:hypothetical protein
MAKGDHIFVPLSMKGLITHHGIDLGDGTVVHWTSGMPGNKSLTDAAARLSNAMIRRTPIEEFGDIEQIKVRVYQRWCYDADVVVERALEKLGRTDYSMWFNNCEHFATWCKIGEDTSAQVDTVTRQLFATGSKAVATTVAKGSTKLVAKQVGRVATPWLLVADAAQFATEVAMNKSGADPESAKTVGRGVGCASSVVIGAAVGGPIGAGVALGLWFFGEVIGEKVGKMVTEKS